MKKNIIASTVLAGLLLSTTSLFANSTGGMSSRVAKAKVEETRSKDAFEAKEDINEFATQAHKDDIDRLKKVVNKVALQHKNALKKAPKEIADALNQSIFALRALHDNKTKNAEQALQKATKLFDAALKQNPKLALVPVADETQVYDFTGDAKLLKHILKTIQDLLKDNDTQTARAMLTPLQDEMQMKTEYLPMGIYPIATKTALKELKNAKPENAFKTLATALNSIVVQIVTIPIPLITAQGLAAEASEMDKSHKKEATKLLAQAKDELDKAVLFGYAKKHTSDYKMLQKDIKNIQTEINGKNKVEKLYKKIANDFDSLFTKHAKDVTNKKH